MKSGGESAGYSTNESGQISSQQHRRLDRPRDTSERVRRIAAECETHGYTIKVGATALVIRKSPECCVLDSGAKKEFEERGALFFFSFFFFF